MRLYYQPSHLTPGYIKFYSNSSVAQSSDRFMGVLNLCSFHFLYFSKIPTTSGMRGTHPTQLYQWNEWDKQRWGKTCSGTRTGASLGMCTAKPVPNARFIIPLCLCLCVKSKALLQPDKQSNNIVSYSCLFTTGLKPTKTYFKLAICFTVTFRYFKNDSATNQLSIIISIDHQRRNS